MTKFSQNLKVTKDCMTATAQKAGREDEITLIAVSKRKPAEAIEAALEAGQRVFGENRVQEAMEKFTPLRQKFTDIKLHLIGPLQTNKAADAVRFFDVIQTVDRPKLAAALAKEATKQGRCPRLYIQVNIGEEPQKAGVSPQNTQAFYKECIKVHGLKIEGLMCIPPQNQAPTPFFALLKDIANELSLPHISMGMSSDYKTAIGQGATEVRVGTALFGMRR